MIYAFAILGGCSLVACEQSQSHSQTPGFSDYEQELMDTVKRLQAEIEALEQLTEQELLMQKYEDQRHEAYGNHIFNNVQPPAQFRFGWGRRTVKTTGMRAGPNDGTELLATVPVNSEIEILANHDQWDSVAWEGQRGWLPRTVICDHHIPYDDEGIDFLIYTSKHNEYGRPAMVTMMAINRSDNEVLGSLEVPFRVKEYWASRTATALKNGAYVLSLNFTRSSCPGHEENYHYAYQDGVFTEISHSFGMGEVDYYSYNTAYLPVRFENNIIHHVANGNVADGIRWSNGSVTSLQIPDSIDLPLHELVVVKSAQGEPAMDEQGNPIVDEDGYGTTHSIGSATHYYRWDGQKLELYKSTNPGFKAGMF